MRAPNQERFASSSEIPYGLLANLVARRCEVLQSPEEIELVYFLQYLSHEPGGLKKVASELIEKFRAEIATVSMLEFGYQEKKRYTPEQASTISVEMPFESGWASRFSPEELLDKPPKYAPLQEPDSFPAIEFKRQCEHIAERELEKYLEELCLNPKQKLSGGPWYFPNLISSLHEWKRERAAREQQSFVATELGKIVHETLDYSLHGGCLTLIDGRARTGKTFAAQKWVALRPGKARFVEIPVGNSEVGFFRAIGSALGLSMKLNHTLRDRIETVLRSKNLMLVFDEAQFAWPDSANREALPFRVSWIMSMVNAGVPISLIVTNQFFHCQKRTERRSGWTSEQFVGRIAFYQPLPEKLSDHDLRAIAKSLLPEGDSDCIEMLAMNAKSSAKYLAGIEFTVKRARYLANKAGREKVEYADLDKAIFESVIPSDKNLAQALAKPERQSGRHKQFLTAPELPQPAEPPAPQTVAPADRHAPRAVAPISNTRETSLVIH